MHAHRTTVSASIAVLIVGTSPCWAVKVTPAELARAQGWSLARFGDGEKAPTAEPPFSFAYSGKPSAEFLKACKTERQTRKLDAARTEHITTYTDSATGLVATCRAVEYADFPTVEWTVTFKNAGEKDTPILADIQAIDATFTRPAEGEFLLRSNKGDYCAVDSYEPWAEPLGPNAKKQLACAGGRSTNVQYPYWNVGMPGGGVIVVIGWPGQWSALFERDATTGLRIRAGQEQTHLVLHPGEQIRSPLAVVQFYDGDWLRAQNIWRRWMVAHNIPRVGGEPPKPFTSICMGLQQSEETETKAIDSYVNNGVKQDYWWMDAGWYPCNGSWPNTGTWEPDPKRFPRGIKAVSDYAHSKGMKLVLWFEPERVAPGSWLTQNHPQWILGGDKGGLLNLGNPGTLKWVIEHFDGLIKEQGIDLYREDFNIDPLAYWRNNDTPDRQGMTENLYIQGHLAYWDELRRRHPDMLIDSCASGGRRNDLETLRRAVPLLRSDWHAPGTYDQPQIWYGNQGHTYGISMWVPYYGKGEYYNSNYAFRSQICPSMGVGYDPNRMPVDWKALKKTIADWQAVAMEFYGDFYPLTKYTLSEEEWIAWQFNRPETGTGLIQAFRHTNSLYESARYRLQGLDPAATYVVTNLDVAGETEMTGRELAEQGLLVVIKDQASAVLITYKKKS